MEINAQNNLNKFLPTKHEKPRLQVLENFKEFNRVIRSNFLAGRAIKGMPESDIQRRVQENKLAAKATGIMK